MRGKVLFGCRCSQVLPKGQAVLRGESSRQVRPMRMRWEGLFGCWRTQMFLPEGTKATMLSGGQAMLRRNSSGQMWKTRVWCKAVLRGEGSRQVRPMRMRREGVFGCWRIEVLLPEGTKT